MELPGIKDIYAKNLLPQDGILEYKSPFYTSEESLEYFKLLKERIDWTQNYIEMFGKVHPLPRLTAWYSDPGISYTYSKIINHPKDWTPELSSLRKDMEEACGTQFNSVLLNYYRDGNDHMSWHADDEQELGVKPIIASLSFGAERKFQLKHKQNQSIPTVSVGVSSGSLLIMKGEIQTYWNHRVSKGKKETGERINLTFRYVQK